MRKILTVYKIDPNFLPVLSSFGDVPNVAESESRNIAIKSMSDGSRSKLAKSCA